MRGKVKVIITNDQHEVKIPTGVRMLVRRACTAVLTLEEFNDPAEISVRFVDDEVKTECMTQILTRARRCSAT